MSPNNLASKINQASKNNQASTINSLLLSLGIIALVGCAATPASTTSKLTSEPASQTLAESETMEPSIVKADIPGQENLSACPLDADNLAQTMISLLNQTRSESRMCGQKNWDAAPPLTLNPVLGLAAARHSADMANNNFFGHEGSNGLTADSRTSEAGYQWFSVAENIAGGQTNVTTVIEDWLDSEDHCKNVMSPDLTEAGAACFRQDNTDLKLYWTLVFARPLLATSE